MDTETFNRVVKAQLQKCEDVLVAKGAEYATEDRLHNFRVAAELQGVDLLESCAGMMAKHTVSIFDMCGADQTFTLAQWDEKITDHMNYLLLLRAIVEEMETEQNPFVIDEINFRTSDTYTQNMEALREAVHDFLTPGGRS